MQFDWHLCRQHIKSVVQALSLTEAVTGTKTFGNILYLCRLIKPNNTIVVANASVKSTASMPVTHKRHSLYSLGG